MNDKQLIDECKIFIERKDLLGLQTFFAELMEDSFTESSDSSVITHDSTELQHYKTHDWPYIFHRVYLHSCLKGHQEAASWLEHTVYVTMDPIQKIALRQIFPYGHHLLRQAANLEKVRQQQQTS
jgi:hypothetical protein